MTYTLPTVSGGSAPVAVTCTPVSGSAFPIGRTPVSCTAQDAAGRTATCGFDVTVALVPLLKGTRFLAFGDSITSGEVSPPPSTMAYEPDHAYPAVLAQLLASRYRAQTTTVTNAGEYGNRAVDDTDRLRSLVTANPPDALILMQGVNDLNSGGDAAIPQVRDALRTDIVRARDAGVKLIVLSTLIPEFVYRGDLIAPMNDEIRDLAFREGVVLVDNYAAFVGKTGLIGIDGLHPTQAGHRLMAENFLAAIAANFEQPAPAATPARR